MNSTVAFTAELDSLIEQGNFLQAIDAAQKILDEVEDHEVRKRLALALSRSGSMRRASECLKPVLADGGMDPETTALFGGILKRSWEISGDESLLRESYDHYLKAFREGAGYWAGINAATLAFAMDMEEARFIADEVLDICWDEYGRMGTRSSFWLLVSIAEAHLVKGDIRTALKWYGLVTPMSYKSVGKIRTVRRNAAILGRKYGEEVLQDVRNSIYTPKVAFFAGHRIDRNGMTPRFRKKDIDPVKKRLRAAIGRNRISVGVASLADGADILFHECLQEAGRQSRVVLPSPVENFRSRLAEDDPGGWVDRFDAVIENASAVETVSSAVFDQYSEETYDLTTDYMIGYALNLAEELDGEMVPLVVWDRKRRERKGGTYSAVRKLRRMGIEPEVVQLPVEHSATSLENADDAVSDRDSPFRTAIAVAGTGSFSTDREKAEKIAQLMNAARDVVRGSGHAVLKRSMGYDEVYLIFQQVDHCGDFLRGMMERSPECTLAAHVDFSLELREDTSGAGQIYSPALSDVVHISRKLASGDCFCTSGFRSLARFCGLDLFDYLYAGAFAVGEGRSLDLFRITARS